MSDETQSDQTPNASPQGDPSAEAGGQPPMTDAEREALEQQMKEIRVEDLLTQTVASVLNLSARRIAKEDEVDLEQARIGIEAVRAIISLLPAEVGEAVREPLSQVQMLYAQRTGQGEESAAPGDPGSGAEGTPQSPGQPPASEPGGGPPGQGPSKLWTPGGN